MPLHAREETQLFVLWNIQPDSWIRSQQGTEPSQSSWGYYSRKETRGPLFWPLRRKEICSLYLTLEQEPRLIADTVRAEELHFSSSSQGPKCLLRDDSGGRPGNPLDEKSPLWSRGTTEYVLMDQFGTALTWAETVSRKSSFARWERRLVARSHDYLPYSSPSPSPVWCVYLIRQRATARMKQFPVIGNLCLPLFI